MIGLQEGGGKRKPCRQTSSGRVRGGGGKSLLPGAARSAGAALHVVHVAAAFVHAASHTGAARSEITTSGAVHRSEVGGYARFFSLLMHGGAQIEKFARQFTGEDRLFPLDPPAEDTAPWAALFRPARGHGFMLHFHLHPDVKAEKEAGAVLLTLPNREGWAFMQEGGLLCLEPSLYLDRTYTEPRPTKQIVVAGRTLEYVSAIRWSFTRL